MGSGLARLWTFRGPRVYMRTRLGDRRGEQARRDTIPHVGRAEISGPASGLSAWATCQCVLHAFARHHPGMLDDLADKPFGTFRAELSSLDKDPPLPTNWRGTLFNPELTRACLQNHQPPLLRLRHRPFWQLGRVGGGQKWMSKGAFLIPEPVCRHVLVCDI